MELKKTRTWAANKIKTELIDFLLVDDNYDLMINEAPFLQGTRWADLIAIHGNTTIGFEVKSEQDGLRTLLEQLNDYMKVFNVVYLILADKFAKQPEISAISKSVGIIIIKHDGKPIVRRKAVSRAKLDKTALLTLLWRKDLEKLAPARRNADMDILRAYVLKNCSINDIQEQIILSLKERYAESYRAFLKDRGTYTTIEDLRTITKLKKNPVLSNIDIG